MVSSVLLAADLALSARIDAWRHEVSRRLASAQHDNAAARGLEARLRPHNGDRQSGPRAASPVESVLARLLTEMRSLPRRRVGEWQIALLPRSGGTVNGGGPDAAQPISAFVEPLPGFSTIKRVAVRVSGRYGTLDELQALLESIGDKPIALRGLRIERDSFELRLEAYGI